MMKRKVKAGSAIFLALAVAFSVFVLPGVWAADAIQVDRNDCSVEFSVGSDYKELLTSDVTIDLYKVASVDKSGTYTAEPDFEGLDVSALDIDDQAGSAAKWSERAASAAQKVTEKKLDATDTVTTTNGMTKSEGLETGLYLIQPEEVVTDNYTYTFAPSLVALPNNYYGNGGSDTWVYNLTGENGITLKPEQHARYGKLVINKTLLHQNVTSGDKATFVFQIDIENPDGTKESKVEALDFKTAGSDSITIEHLRAGADVTVTEVYSGASYSLVSDNPVKAKITANDEYSSADAPTAEVSFKNDTDGRPNGGYGIVNNFKLNKNGLYDHIKPAQ